jgi:hypothetical protein
VAGRGDRARNFFAAEMKNSRRFFRKKLDAAKNAREKKCDDFLKLHLTHSPEKHNSKRVINFYLHDFARYVRHDEGVIFHGNS